jgi:uncharacterized repeat protein (TIGR01451 family)
VTSQDVRDGSVVNHATATGDGAGGTRVTSDDVVEITAGQPGQPGIRLVKDADTNGPVHVGDQITYSFTVTNTGNVTLTSVTVSDPLLGVVTCQETTLAAGQSTACSAAPYLVTAEDVANGEVVNRATARGRTRGGVAVTDTDAVVVAARATEGLPDTGSPVSPAVPLVALGMLGAGASLMFAGRRSRDRER